MLVSYQRVYEPSFAISTGVQGTQATRFGGESLSRDPESGQPLSGITTPGVPLTC